MSHLNPRDLCRSAQVCKQWSEVTMDPSLWRNLHPVEWARGNVATAQCSWLPLENLEKWERIFQSGIFEQTRKVGEF